MSLPLIKNFDYPAPLELVWEVLTSATFMKQWYFPQLTSFEPVVGFRFHFTDDGQPYRKEWTVTRIDKPNTFAHSWDYAGYPGTSEVIFELKQSGDATHLSVVQIGLDSFPKDPHFARERFEAGWDNLLGVNLRRVLEVQKGRLHS